MCPVTAIGEIMQKGWSAVQVIIAVRLRLSLNSIFTDS